MASAHGLGQVPGSSPGFPTTRAPKGFQSPWGLSYWIRGCALASTALLTYEQPFKTLLGIPADKRLLTLIPIGAPAESPTPEKKSLCAVLRWEQYA